jgi:hypothetical protein
MRANVRSDCADEPAAEAIADSSTHHYIAGPARVREGIHCCFRERIDSYDVFLDGTGGRRPSQCNVARLDCRHPCRDLEAYVAGRPNCKGCAR